MKTALLAIAVCAQACSFSKPSLVQHSFSFTPFSLQTNTNRAPIHQVLGVRKVVIQAPFDNQSFTYRTGPYSFEQDPYAQFLGPPVQSLSSTLESSIRRAGVFADVAPPGSLLSAQVFLEVYVDKLYGDFQNGQPPAAVLDARFAFFGPAQASDRRPLLDREYTGRAPLQARTAAAVVAGWNEALRQITSQALKDIARQMNQSQTQAAPASK